MQITNVKELRKDFPIFRHRAYVDTACYAPGYAKVAEAVNDWYKSSLLIPCIFQPDIGMVEACCLCKI